MGKSKVRTLVLASMMIMLCMAMLVGGSYALWSMDKTYVNHLQAGELALTLERTALTKHVLNGETGYLDEITDDSTVDFTNNRTANVFGIENGEIVVPMSSYEATMKITNNGDVAFEYSIVIQLKNDVNDLAKQLKVYVDKDATDNRGYEEVGSLDDFAEVNKQIVVFGNVAKDKVTSFRVKIEFENNDTFNNDAMSQSISFDLIVKAVQLPTDPGTLGE